MMAGDAHVMEYATEDDLHIYLIKELDRRMRNYLHQQNPEQLQTMLLQRNLVMQYFLRRFAPSLADDVYSEQNWSPRTGVLYLFLYQKAYIDLTVLHSPTYPGDPANNIPEYVRLLTNLFLPRVGVSSRTYMALGISPQTVPALNVDNSGASQYLTKANPSLHELRLLPGGARYIKPVEAKDRETFNVAESSDGESE